MMTGDGSGKPNHGMRRGGHDRPGSPLESKRNTGDILCISFFVFPFFFASLQPTRAPGSVLLPTPRRGK